METEENSIIEIIPCDGGVEAVVRQDPVNLNAFRKRLAAINNLVRVSLMEPVSSLKSLCFLNGISSLRHLHFNSSPKGTDYSVLETLPLLNEITTGNRCWFDCSTLPKLPHLKVFRTGPKAISIEDLSHCKSLEWIELGGAKSIDCSFLSGLTNLNRLRLWDCKILHTRGLDQCPQIRKLDFGRSSIVEIEALLETPELLILQLENCTKIVDFSPIKRCRKLRQLDVSQCKFKLGADTIGILTDLEIFSGVGFNLDDDECQALLELPNLKKISVSKKYEKCFSRLANGVKVYTY